MRFTLHFLPIVVAATALTPATAQVVIATVPSVIPYTIAVNPTTNQAYAAGCADQACHTGVTIIDGNHMFSTQLVGLGTYGNSGGVIAVNAATNKIYVADCGSDASCRSTGMLTVIDGITLETSSLPVGYGDHAIALNSNTNKIYIANSFGDEPFGSGIGTVTVVDGATLSTQTVAVGYSPAGSPYSIAVDSIANKIYVTNHCISSSCETGTVTIIDGVTLSTQTVAVGNNPQSVVVSSTTNKIYVTNFCGNDPSNCSNGTVTVIDGQTLLAQTVRVGVHPYGAAVNPTTNKIYVANSCGNDPTCESVGTVTVIDGTTLATSTVAVAASPLVLAADSNTDEVYVANLCGSDPECSSGVGFVTLISSATNSTTSIAVGDSPLPMAINESTSEVFVGNADDATISIIGENATLQFVPVAPCRLVDTRGPNGPFGGPVMQGDSTRSFPIPQNPNCPIPTSAAAYSLNVTVVPRGPLAYLTIWPTPERRQLASTLNSTDGRVKANAAIVPAGVSGAVSVYVTDTTDVILDVDGYFTTSGPQTLQFYTLTPCRVVDTRGASGDLGGPFLTAQVERDFPVLESTCIPSELNIAAYSMNFTVVPHEAGQPLGYLTVWPQGQLQPAVSTLNNPTATVVANAAIVPAGSGGGIATYALNDTDLVVDINGYFAPLGPGGYSFYPVTPCRVFDSRNNDGQPFTGQIIVPVASSQCAPPSNAGGYVFNATVVPSASLGYLTLWPDPDQQPAVSTLNAYDGFITSNMAIVPNSDGSTDAFAEQGYPGQGSGFTQLILDIFGYFAP